MISHCLQRRNPLADGALTCGAVTQSGPVGCGAEPRPSPVGAAGSGGGAAASSRPSGGSMGSAELQPELLPEGPSLQIPGDLGDCFAKKWA